MVKKRKSGALRFLIAIIIISIISFLIIDKGNFVLKLAYPVKYTTYVSTFSKANNIDPFLVLAVINSESGFDPNAVSPKNAIGLMQIRENTGDWVAKKLNLQDYSKDKLFSPETNIRIGCWFLSGLINEFDNNIELALASYNAGSGNVTKWIEDKRISKNNLIVNDIPFKETREYVKKVKKLQVVYRRLYENIFWW